MVYPAEASPQLLISGIVKRLNSIHADAAEIVSYNTFKCHTGVLGLSGFSKGIAAALHFIDSGACVELIQITFVNDARDNYGGGCTGKQHTAQHGSRSQRNCVLSKPYRALFIRCFKDKIVVSEGYHFKYFFFIHTSKPSSIR